MEAGSNSGGNTTLQKPSSRYHHLLPFLKPGSPAQTGRARVNRFTYNFKDARQSSGEVANGGEQNPTIGWGKLRLGKYVDGRSGLPRQAESARASVTERGSQIREIRGIRRLVFRLPAFQRPVDGGQWRPG